MLVWAFIFSFWVSETSSYVNIRQTSSLMGKPTFLESISTKKTESFAQSIDNIISFGALIDIKIPMIPRDEIIAKMFLNDPMSILFATWDTNKISVLSNTSYILRCKDIPLLGIDSITPEICFDVTTENENVCMIKSKSWALRGGSKLLRDSEFLQSFDIAIEGSIQLLQPSCTVAEGWVRYKVEGKKPLLFRALPGFIMDRVIILIQDRIGTFARDEFTRRFQEGYRLYVRDNRVALTRQNVATS